MSNLCEYLRGQAVDSLFKMNSFQDVWPVWQEKIYEILGTDQPTSASQIIELGDHLYDIFKSTGESGRGQGSVSAGGAVWEALVCWYLNLCLLGSRGVIIKQSKALIPEPISHSLVVKYNNFKSNTESDLVGLILPDSSEYIDNLNEFSAKETRQGTPFYKGNKLNYKPLIDDLSESDFRHFEVSVIQCKTNWNDNAQIPMLWDMLYRTKEFLDRGIVVGDRNYSIQNLKRFSYSFATVPSVNPEKLKASSVAVKRVRNITGGNYWGLPSKNDVAENISEIISRNFHSSFGDEGFRSNLTSALNDGNIDKSCFKLGF